MSTQPVDKDGLRKNPQYMRHAMRRRETRDDRWYYEESGGLWFGMKGTHDTLSAWIPIAQLRAYLKRHDGGPDAD